MGGGKQGGGGGHHGLEKTFGLVLASIVAFTWGLAALQAAVAMVTPTVRAATSWLEAHGVLIGVVIAVVTCGYVWLRLKVASRRAARTRWSGEQPVVYQYDPRRDRPGLLGTFGRWLAFRSGGPLIVSGGAPVQRVAHPAEDELIDEDEDQVQDEDEESTDVDTRRYTTREARAIFSRAMRPRHR